MALLRRPTMTEFENGMVVVNHPNIFMNASSLCFLVGHRDDPPWFPGAAHISEHILCRGASDRLLAKYNHEDRPLPVSGRQMDRMMRRYLGGSDGPGMNIYTTACFTSYGHNDLPGRKALRAVTGTMWPIVRDGMYELRRMRHNEGMLDLASLRVERPAVDNEDRGNNDDAFQAACSAASSALFSDNRAGHGGCTEHEKLKGLKLGRLKQWAQKQYVPENLRVVLVGPTSNEALRMVREHELDALPAWKAQSYDDARVEIVPELTSVIEVTTERPKLNMRHVLLLWPTEPFTSEDRPALQVLTDVVKDRVENELRESNEEIPGGVYHPAAEWDASVSHGCISLWFSTHGDAAHAAKLTERALGVVHGIQNDTSSRLMEDVDDARTFLATSFVQEFKFDAATFCDSLMLFLASADRDRDTEKSIDAFVAHPNTLMAVTAEDVRSVAEKYLKRDAFVKSVVNPV